MRNLLGIAALLVPAAAFAGGYAVPNTNARDLAMAGSAGAAQKDATAAYVNPAALSGLEGLSVVVNGTMIDFRSTWNAPDGSASSQSNLKLCKSAETQICRAGPLGLTTNTAWSGSSKVTFSTPASKSLSTR